jgi:uncharacterized phiE125 gp8 family phage protein
MSSFIQTVTDSGNAPVNIADALRHLRALESDTDMVWNYLLAATQAVEDYTGRSLTTKTFRLLSSDWPEGRIFELRRTPLVSITDVKYYASGDTALTTMSASAYRAHTGRTPGAVEFLPDTDLEGLESRLDGVQVTFVAGYGAAAYQIPNSLRLAVLMLAHHWFDERRPVADAKGASEMPFSLRHLLRSYRVDSQLAIP